MQVSLPKGKSMNTRFYRNKDLRKIVKFYQKCWPKIGICGIYLYHENATSHKFGVVFCKNSGLCSRAFTLVPWSSPPWLFPHPSSHKKPCWQKYTSSQKLGASILNLLRGITMRKSSRIGLKVENLFICERIVFWQFEINKNAIPPIVVI